VIERTSITSCAPDNLHRVSRHFGASRPAGQRPFTQLSVSRSTEGIVVRSSSHLSTWDPNLRELLGHLMQGRLILSPPMDPAADTRLAFAAQPLSSSRC